MSLAAQRWWCLLEATERAWLTVHGARARCLLREWAPDVNIEQLLRACAAIGLARGFHSVSVLPSSCSPLTSAVDTSIIRADWPAAQLACVSAHGGHSLRSRRCARHSFTLCSPAWQPAAALRASERALTSVCVLRRR